MENEARILLEDTIAFCQEDGQDSRLINMLEQSEPLALTDDALTIQVPSRFAYSYLIKHQELIEGYLSDIAFAPLRLEVTVAAGRGGARRPVRTSTEDVPGIGAAPASGTTAPDAAVGTISSDSSAPVAPTAPVEGDAGTSARSNANAGEADASSFVIPPARIPVPAGARTSAGFNADVYGMDTPVAPSAPSASPATAAAVSSAPAVAPFVPPAGAFASGPADSAAAKSINVKNTVSADDFRKMMAEMKSETAAPRPASASSETRDTAPSAPEEETYPSVGINTKFTFENFVFGDENKHAYQSSLRFAAFADQPGQCTSLFIYGNSGLGKTHLLFAITNYLAQEKPSLKVKYANAQAYFEDYLHDLGMQKGPGDPIMRAYREADILIIDDIQNILGKQATIEYFFQLVDEFIRSGKKIVIASDRAPKKLGLDERLTSRFNAGMLCLVSEPGFEMKYAILKRYYENIIMGSGDLAHMNVDTSLLSALQVREGHLTDEQLRHMAEISGNNIRELESFCERCAGLSSEREAEGAELTGEDIDHIASQYFDTAHKVIHIDTVQSVVEEYYHVSHEELIGPRRTANIAFARHVAVYLANNLCEMTTPAIGAEFGGRDHSTVLNSLKVVENKMKEDRRICEDLQQLKNKIILKS